MASPGDRLKELREQREFTTASAAAKAMGVSVATYIQHENGTRGIPADKAKQYADFLRSTPEWILYGRRTTTPVEVRPPPRPISRRAGRKIVPLVGYVGAGAEAHYYGGGDGNLDYVDGPEDASDTTVAVEVRGTSLGPLFERWLIFYDEVRSPVTTDLYGRMCVVGLPDDRILVKLIRPASAPGIFHLLSNTEPPIFDQEVMWAARVKSMTPR